MPGENERECDYCHVTDREGHHQTVRNVEGQGLVMVSGHFACCTAQPEGCPDGTCEQILSGATP